jgi:uncharacterized Zn-finger protein
MTQNSIGNLKAKCKFCEKEFKNITELKEHYDFSGICEKREFNCPYCEKFKFIGYDD